MKKPIFIRKYLTGNIVPIRMVAPQHRKVYTKTLRAAARAARACKQKFVVRSSYRTFEEQQYLYSQYLHHGGNLAAKPGTSRHEKGNALDLGNYRNVDVGFDERAKKALIKHGFVFAVASESWHVEYKG